jgi:Animal haem peroxidase
MRERQVFIVGKGFVPLTTPGQVNGNPHPSAIKGLVAAPAPVSVSAPNGVRPERAFRYGEMFGKTSKFHPDEKGLQELGDEMHVPLSGRRDLLDLPAGYTYLGQFITHDTTFDKTAEIPGSELSPDQIKQGRSPSLNLDCIYGMGPQSEASRRLYENDGVRFRVGQTTPTLLGNATKALPNDLPRDSSDPATPRKALIADPRNDRNLPLAQTHLAFLKFHNAVVNCLAGEGMLGKELFEAARKKVIQHYQRIVLRDYLEKILDRAVLKDILDNGVKYFKCGPDGELFLPIEFAFGAFRFGHSLVRDKYDWNRVFNSSNLTDTDQTVQSRKEAPLHKLFMITGGNGNLEGALTLPSNWIIDWTRFYNFNGASGSAQHDFNRAKKIDTSLSPGLANLPGFPAYSQVNLPSMATLDLLMGSRLGMLTGQEVANEMGVVPLDIASGSRHSDILNNYKFAKNTPLWYYILREAEISQKGKRLGEVGSRIVGETIVGLIEASEFSILKEENWRPDPKLGKSRGKFEMTDLLLFVNDLNPLGEEEASQAPTPSAAVRLKPKPSAAVRLKPKPSRSKRAKK